MELAFGELTIWTELRGIFAFHTWLFIIKSLPSNLNAAAIVLFKCLDATTFIGSARFKE